MQVKFVGEIRVLIYVSETLHNIFEIETCFCALNFRYSPIFFNFRKQQIFYHLQLDYKFCLYYIKKL